MAIKERLVNDERDDLTKDVDDLDAAYIQSMKDKGIDADLLEQFAALLAEDTQKRKSGQEWGKKGRIALHLKIPYLRGSSLSIPEIQRMSRFGKRAVIRFQTEILKFVRIAAIEGWAFIFQFCRFWDFIWNDPINPIQGENHEAL